METVIIEQIVEIALDELFIAIMKTKCCARSRKKWEKIRKCCKKDKEDRSVRVQESLRRNSLSVNEMKVTEI